MNKVSVYTGGLLIAFSLLLQLVACSDDDPVYTPVITMENNNLTFAGNGETIRLNYNVSGAPDGFLLPEAVTDADWVKVVDHTTLGTLTLQAETAPFSVASRTATLTLTLPEYPEVKAICTLTQNKNQDAFYIDIERLSSAGVIYTVTPASESQSTYYLSYCFTEEEDAAMENDPANYIAAMRAIQLEQDKEYPYNLRGQLAGFSRMYENCGDREIHHGLKPGTRYCLMAVGFDGSISSNKEVYATPVVKRFFTTPDEAEELPAVNYDVKVDVRGVLASASVNPGSSEVWTYALNLTPEGYQLLTDGTSTLNTPLSLYLFGYSYDRILSRMRRGAYTDGNVDVWMKADSEYRYCTRAYSDFLTPLTEWVSTAYTTTTAQASDNTFQVECNWEDACKCIFHVTPANADSYKAYAFRPSEVEGMSDDEIFALIEKNCYLTYTGTDSGYTLVIPETDYLVMVVGVAGADAVRTTPVYSFPVTVPPLRISDKATGAIEQVLVVDGDEYAEVTGSTAYKNYNLIAYRYNCSDETDYMADFLTTTAAYNKSLAADNGLNVLYYTVRNKGSYWDIRKLSYRMKGLPKTYKISVTILGVPMEGNILTEPVTFGPMIAKEVDLANPTYATVEELVKLIQGTSTRSLDATVFSLQPYLEGM